MKMLGKRVDNMGPKFDDFGNELDEDEVREVDILLYIVMMSS